MTTTQQPTNRPATNAWVLRSWIAVALIPVFLFVAILIGYLIYGVFGYVPEDLDVPDWVELIVGVVTLAVFLIPCVGAVFYGWIANKAHDRRGLVPLAIGGIVGTLDDGGQRCHRCVGDARLTALSPDRVRSLLSPSGAACSFRLAVFSGVTRDARKEPVWLSVTAATCSGVPSATICPPPEPPSGPRSMSQSAVLMTSRLCSITITELPASTSLPRTPSSLRMSSKCRPVVGSSRT